MQKIFRMDNCQCHNETARDGSGQLGRYLKALDPSYAPVDGRSLEDLLVFAKRYAAQVRFYDIPESKINDDTPASKVSWREFFRRDMSVIAASIAIVDLEQIKQDYTEIRNQLDLHPGTEIFAALFSPILGMAARIDRWYSVAVPENPLRQDLTLGINSLLREQMKKVIAYEEGFKYVDPKKGLKLNYTAIENDAVWGINDKIDPDYSIYEGIEPEDKIKSGALFVDDIFHAFYGFISDVVEKSESYMHYAMELYPGHQPHMALFITFLRIFQLAQNQMNGLTERMLNFYYREVLHLTEKPSMPDRVHIVFELAKDVSEYDLAKGTNLKAGKDAAGKEQLYATENDLVISQAKVKELKTIYIEKLPIDDVEESSKEIKSVYARPVANSLDGFGEKFTDPNPKWHTFGQGSAASESSNNPCEIIKRTNELLNRNDIAQVGFAIATPQLVLQGGKRWIGLHIYGLQALLEAAVQANETGESFFQIWFSGEKGWLKIDKVLSDSDKNERLGKYFEFGLFNPEADDIESSYLIDKEASTLYVYLSVAEVPVIPYTNKLHKGYDFKTTYPVMMVMLNSKIELSATEYEQLSISNLELSVKVGSINPEGHEGNPDVMMHYHFDGLKTLILQNDLGLLASGKPFDPFTAYPVKGKSFYIGSNEVFNKPLGRLAINIKRTEDDASNNDSISDWNNKDLDYAVSVLHDREWDNLFNDYSQGFYQGQLTRNILFHRAGSPYEPNPVSLPRKPVVNNTQLETGTEKGFLRLSNLTPTPTAEAYAQGQNPAAGLQIKEISVSYESDLTALEAGIDQFFHIYPFGPVETYVGPMDDGEQMPNYSFDIPQPKTEFLKLDKERENLLVDAHNHLLPQFTFLSPYAPLQSKSESDVISYGDNLNYLKKADTSSPLKGNISRKDLLAKLIYEASGLQQKLTGNASQYSGLIQEEGMLFIGIEKLKPLQTLSLLFQFAEGSAEDEDNDPPPINWSYLTCNEWRPLKGENVISDGTYGFQTTGIVKIDIPADANDHNTIITDGLHWLCASVTNNSNRIPQLVDVVAQAVVAKFNDQNNDQSHFDKALSAGSISKLEVAAASVSKVIQPFASFDGKHKEVGKEYYIRVSERLRHKARAITAWDYEHLVLDRFPSIYKVKCITHTDPDCICRHAQTAGRRTGEFATFETGDLAAKECCGPQVAPGHILIVPIANLKNRNAADPLQPKTSRRTLLEIEEYIKKRTSPFVRVHAKNPVYEQVIVSFKVKFYTGTDRGYFLKKLNDEIVHYLTPWAFDETAEVSFNQKIYASSIVNFIEERPYVDFITDFIMAVCVNECCSGETPGPEEPAEDGNSNNEETNNTYPGNGDGNNENSATILSNMSGCSEMERQLEDMSEMEGEIVATPSTARSILVSVPKHIIVPYEEPEQLSRCGQRKIDKGVIIKGARVNPIIIKKTDYTNAAPVAPAPIAPVVTDTATVSAAPQKAAGTTPAEKGAAPVVEEQFAAPLVNAAAGNAALSSKEQPVGEEGSAGEKPEETLPEATNEKPAKKSKKAPGKTDSTDEPT